MFKLTGKRPTNLGVTNGRLAPPHHIAPLDLEGDAAAAMKKLRAVVEGMVRTKVIESRADYLYAEFATPLMGYVDDVEFYCDGRAIHVRSASRLGYSDLGVNRKRVEAIRAAL